MDLQNSKAPMDTHQKFSEKCLINSTAKKATILDLEYQKVSTLHDLTVVTVSF